MLSRWLPFLFEEQKNLTAQLIEQTKQIATIDTPKKNALIDQLARAFPQLDQESQAEAYQHITEAFRLLAEDHVTAVRVALSSALKDVAQVPPGIARKLANDAERQVAEPILRFCMSLSDQDLLELIRLHPEQWQTEIIAGRKRVSGSISHAVSQTRNVAAHRTLLNNDGATIDENTLQSFRNNGDYKDALKARASLHRRLKREWLQMTERALYLFLRDQANLDKETTTEVMQTTYERMQLQDKIKTTDTLQTEEQIRNALMLGENDIVIKALSQRAAIPIPVVRRMIEAGSGRAVVALCVRAEVSLRLGVLIQQRLSRLPPAKIVYPRDDDTLPLTKDELRWQYEFFGINP